MYEQNDIPMYRRLILIGVSAVVLIAIIWLLIWLFFFRSTAKVAAPQRPTPSQSQSPKSGERSVPAKPSNGTSGTNTQGQINAPGQSTTATPTPGGTGTGASQLANTGPGDIFLPVGAVTVAGTVLYYVRLRKRLGTNA